MTSYKIHIFSYKIYLFDRELILLYATNLLG